jgi:hypothetical protein
MAQIQITSAEYVKRLTSEDPKIQAKAVIELLGKLESGRFRADKKIISALIATGTGANAEKGVPNLGIHKISIEVTEALTLIGADAIESLTHQIKDTTNGEQRKLQKLFELAASCLRDGREKFTKSQRGELIAAIRGQSKNFGDLYLKQNVTKWLDFQHNAGNYEPISKQDP